MEFNLITNKEKWNSFVIKQKGSFLQSFEWGEFQKNNSKKVFRVEVKEKETLLEAQIIKNPLPLKSYFYIPYGPVLNSSFGESAKAVKFLFDNVRELAKKEDAFFLKIEPVSFLPDFSELKNSLKRIQPQRTLVFDLENSEEELLEKMKKNTRYNIGLAERKGVKIKILDDYSDIFYELLSKTKERQGFHSYPEEYYRRMFGFNDDRFRAQLFLAEWEGKSIAATIAVFFGEVATSLHTGFDSRHKELKAPYLLRWRIIQEAKRRGCKEYDFWGIDEKKWPGVTSLKRGFGGRDVEYGLGKEIIFNKNWHRMYKILRKFL